MRWNYGVLEQRYLKTDGSTVVWVPVPGVQPEQRIAKLEDAVRELNPGLNL